MKRPGIAMHRNASNANRPEPLQSVRALSQKVDLPQPDMTFGAQCERISSDRSTLFATARPLLPDGVPVPIGTHAIDILITLVARRVVEDSLLTEAWPATCVDPKSLQPPMIALRKRLGDPDGRLIAPGAVTAETESDVPPLCARGSTQRALPQFTSSDHAR